MDREEIISNFAAVGYTTPRSSELPFLRCVNKAHPRSSAEPIQVIPHSRGLPFPSRNRFGTPCSPMHSSSRIRGSTEAQNQLPGLSAPHGFFLSSFIRSTAS